MDELDSALVRMLQEGGRRTNRDMAQVLGIAPSTCLERIRSLRERGVLTGFHAEADLAAVGRGLQTPSQTSVLSRLDKDGMSSVGGLAAAERVRHQSVAATGGVLVERGLVSAAPTPGTAAASSSSSPTAATPPWRTAAWPPPSGSPSWGA